MTYQTIYSSEATAPMQSEDLEELLEDARRRNGIAGISGALIYANGMFLQILEGEAVDVRATMARIRKDLRHEQVTILREGEVPGARFGSWKMAYLSATPAQVARWAGLSVADGTGSDVAGDGEEVDRVARFARDILALLTPEESGGGAPEQGG